MIKKLKRYLRSADCNRIVQEICAVLIGLALGLYGYESKVALVPLKWQIDRKVAEDLAIDKANPQQTPQRPSVPQEPKREIKPEQPRGLDKFISKVVDQEVNQFLKETDRYVKNIDKYVEKMVDHGIRGSLKENMDELMRDGVETVPKKWTSEENKPFFILAVILLAACILLKVMLYLHIVSLNRLRDKIFQIRVKSAKERVDWNGILQEIGTIGIGSIGGLYLQPILEEFLKGETATFPYPFALITAFIACIFLKLAVSSSFLDLSAWIYSKRKYPLFSTKRLNKFSKSYDWNGFAQGICSIIVSIGLGFYAYESNLALLPLKWKTEGKVAEEVARESVPQAKSDQKPQPKTQPHREERREPPKPDSKSPGLFNKWMPREVNEEIRKAQQEVEREVKKAQKEVEKTIHESSTAMLTEFAREFDNVMQEMGVQGNLKQKMEQLLREGVDTVPNKWTEPANLPYLIAATILFLASFVLKFLLYFHVLDLNRLFRKTEQAASRKKKKRIIEWAEIVEETINIALGTILGLYTDPIKDLLAGQSPVSFPYPRICPCIIVVCVILKFLIYLDILKFGRTNAATPLSKSDEVRKKRPH